MPKEVRKPKIQITLDEQSFQIIREQAKNYSIPLSAYVKFATMSFIRNRSSANELQ